MEDTSNIENAEKFCFPVRCLEDSRIKLVPFKVNYALLRPYPNND